MWKYKVEILEGETYDTVFDFEDRLNELGREGWELTFMIDIDNDAALLIFKQWEVA